MKFLVIGGSGTLGYYLIKKFKENNENFEFTVNNNKIDFENQKILDITNEDDTFDLIQKSNPDVVIHTAALTNLDLCEKNHQLANSINVLGTKNIIKGCKNTKSKICYVSTSFVFDGKKESYVEDDVTSPPNFYGFTKIKAEQMVQESGLEYLILRTDSLYGWTENFQRINPVIRVINTLKSENNLKEIINWYNTPTFIPDFVNALQILLKTNKRGIYHVSGSEYLNRFSLAMKTAEVFNLNKKLLIPINSDLLNLSAKRVNVNLKNEKLLDHTGIRMKDVDGGLKEMRKNKVNYLKN